jgi:hypothetical protein
MKCEDVVHAIPMYLYGEVSPAMEEQLEDHFAVCQACARELRLSKSIHAVLNDRELSVPAGLLQECRGDLARQIDRQPVRHAGLGAWLRDLLHGGIRLRVPVGAVALVALGFFAARLPGPFSANSNHAGIDSGPAFSAIRAIEPQASGTVRISLDEVQRREVTGRLDDQKIQRLLLDAMREENNPGLRVESLGVLRECAQSSPVRAALLDAVAHDSDPGVRIKALDGLKPFTAAPDVRQALSQVLLHDKNPGVRIRTIDVLSAQPDDAVAGMLQDVFQKEDDQHVRVRVRNALVDMHATVGTF